MDRPPFMAPHSFASWPMQTHTWCYSMSDFNLLIWALPPSTRQTSWQQPFTHALKVISLSYLRFGIHKLVVKGNNSGKLPMKWRDVANANDDDNIRVDVVVVDVGNNVNCN